MCLRKKKTQKKKRALSLYFFSRRPEGRGAVGGVVAVREIGNRKGKEKSVETKCNALTTGKSRRGKTRVDFGSLTPRGRLGGGKFPFLSRFSFVKRERKGGKSEKRGGGEKQFRTYYLNRVSPKKGKIKEKKGRGGPRFR